MTNSSTSARPAPGEVAHVIEVDLERSTNLRRIWRFIGYDEPNYTYTARGTELLRKIGSLPDSPYYVRTHFLLCSGDGTGRPKWGSTNVCSCETDGSLRFDWTIWDRIFDSHLESGCIPFVELGFTPEGLASAPPGTRYDDPRKGAWRFPPNDLARWGLLIEEVARHCLERYGSREVSRWYWELWNEPDIFYWTGTVEDYEKLFDATEAALHSVIPFARLGGPATTNPSEIAAHTFLEHFLDHCVTGRNYHSGRTGTRLDFVTFHAKGGHVTRDPQASKNTPTIERLIANVEAGLKTVAERRALHKTEIILSECDPDGWAAGGLHDNPNLHYRNGAYYASYFALSVCRLIDLCEGAEARVDGMLTWAFQFENREYFEGLRTLSTNGIDKPVLAAFRLFSRLGGRRVGLEVNASSTERGGGEGASPQVPQVAGIATLVGESELRILLVSHADDWNTSTKLRVEAKVRGLPRGATYKIEETTVDSHSANAYTAWRELGAPQEPTEDEIERLLEASRLTSRPLTAQGAGGALTFEVEMEPHSLHLVTVLR